MSQPTIDYHREAVLEAREAYEWYLAEGGSSLADRFDAALDDAIARAAERPTAYPSASPDSRAILVHDFRYRIIYRPTLTGIYIVAVMHTSRRPGYWKRRGV